VDTHHVSSSFRLVLACVLAAATLLPFAAAGPGVPVVAAQSVPPPATSITSVAVEGDRAYVVDERPFGTSLRVLDVSNPARPRQLIARQLGSCGGPARRGRAAPSPTSSASTGRTLSTPATEPLFARSLGSLRYPAGSVVAGDRLYVTSSYSGGPRLQVLSLADPAQPVQVANISLPGSTVGYRIAATETHVFVDWRANTSTPPQLTVVDVTNSADPRVVATTALSGDAVPYAVATDGRYVYVAVGAQIDEVDVGVPAEPREVGAVASRVGPPGRMVVMPGRLYAAGGDGLQAFDLADPVRPSSLGVYASPSQSTDVAVAGQRAYLALGAGGLAIVDMADPSRPTVVGTYAGERTLLPFVPQHG
jgi:hypothetical protein